MYLFKWWGGREERKRGGGETKRPPSYRLTPKCSAQKSQESETRSRPLVECQEPNFMGFHHCRAEPVLAGTQHPKQSQVLEPGSLLWRTVSWSWGKMPTLRDRNLKGVRQDSLFFLGIILSLFIFRSPSPYCPSSLSFCTTSSLFYVSTPPSFSMLFFCFASLKTKQKLLLF